MTEFTTPREALEYYQAVRPDSIMGYRPYVECAVSLQLITSGALEWRAIEGVKYGKLTDRGLFMLEQLYHMDTQAQLDAAHKRIAELEKQLVTTEQQGSDISLEWNELVEKQGKRIAELEAVCREVVEALHIERESSNSIQVDRRIFYEWIAPTRYAALCHLLDTLPPSE